MKPRQYQLFLHPLFAFSVGLLFVNDALLKYQLHDAFTGKLSDFAGVFALALFLLAFFPTRRVKVLLFAALSFTWWKSPLSQPFIDVFNRILVSNMNRVVDYSDLLALLMLPLAYQVAKMQGRIPPTSRGADPRIALAAILSVVVFCHTTYPYRSQLYYANDNRISFGNQIKTTRSGDQVLDDLSAAGYSWRIDSVRYRQIGNREIYMRTKNANDSFILRRIPNSNDSAVIVIEKDYTPFYVIDSIKVNDDMLRNVEIRITRVNKKTAVTVLSFESSIYGSYNELDQSKHMKSYRRFFEKIFD